MLWLKSIPLTFLSRVYSSAIISAVTHTPANFPTWPWLSTLSCPPDSFRWLMGPAAALPGTCCQFSTHLSWVGVELCVGRQRSKSTPYSSISVLLLSSSLPTSFSLQLSWAMSLLVHFLWHMINPTSHISFHVSAPSLLYRLILKWSDRSTLKYHQIKTAGMCKQRKYAPEPTNQMEGNV